MKSRSRLRFVLEGIEGLFLSGAIIFTWPLARRWLDDWGARPGEIARAWAGDALVSDDHHAHTRAIEIEAPPDAVWPWIVQFGLGKAGFYSYELLERIVGIPVTNLESIEPSMQSLEVGDEVLLHPKAPGIPVGFLEPRRHICFGVDRPTDSGDPKRTPDRSWSLYLEPMDEDSTRLVVRSCTERIHDAPFSNRLAGMLEHPVDFLMEQKMLRTIKRLAEKDWRAGAR